jgi:hypothetical protein
MTDQSLQRLILEEVRQLRTSLEDHKEESSSRLAKLETHMESLVGGHQPGRLTVLEQKVSALQQWRHTTTGIYMGLSGLISAATGWLYHLVIK